MKALLWYFLVLYAVNKLVRRLWDESDEAYAAGKEAGWSEARKSFLRIKVVDSDDEPVHRQL